MTNFINFKGDADVFTIFFLNLTINDGEIIINYFTNLLQIYERQKCQPNKSDFQVELGSLDSINFFFFLNVYMNFFFMIF